MLSRALYEFLRKKQYATKTVAFGGRKLKVEVADTFMKKMIGLMYRESLGRNDGMLFPIAQPGILSATVTMMNMRFGLDIIWLDSAGVVVDVAERLQPSSSPFDSHAPKKIAAYVLELNAGAAHRLGIKKGDEIKV